MYEKIGGISLPHFHCFSHFTFILSSFLPFILLFGLLFCCCSFSKEKKRKETKRIEIYSFVYFISNLTPNSQKSLCEWRTICPYDYANFQWKIDDDFFFYHNISLFFYDSLKNFTTQSFSFFSICLEMTCGKISSWLIVKYSHWCICAHVSVCMYV